MNYALSWQYYRIGHYWWVLQTSYIFTILIIIHLFVLDEIPAAFLIQQIFWWWTLSALFCYCFFGMFSISLSFLKSKFPGYDILPWQFYFLSIFEYIIPSLLVCKVSTEKSLLSVMMVSYMWWLFFFSCCFKNCLCLWPQTIYSQCDFL